MVDKLDFSALEGMNIPGIEENPENEILQLTQDDTNQIKELVIQEVNSFEDFNKADTTQEAEIPKDQLEAPVTEEVETTEVQNQEQETQENTEDPEVSIIKGLSEWARSESLFDYKDEEFEDSTDFLKNKINEVAEQKAEEKLKELPDVIYELAKNYKEGVPLDELIYSKSREIEYNSIDEDKVTEDKELQKRLVSDYLSNRDPDLTEEQIDKKIKKYEDSLLLEDEAKEALQKLRIFEKKYQEKLVSAQKEKNLEAQQEYNKRVQSIENEILGMDEIIPGIQVSKEERKKLIEAYTKPDKQGKTQMMKLIEKDPNMKYKIAQFVVLMEGNLKGVETKLKTQVSKQAKQVVNTYKETSLGKINYSTIKKALDISKKTNKI